MTQITLNNNTYTSSEIHLIPCETSWQKSIVNFLQEWFDEKDTITVQTSGSTGTPKTYQLAKESMVNSAKMTNEFFGLENTKTALLCLPVNYIGGKMMLVRAIVGGFNLLTVKPSANPFEEIKDNIDFLAITPYQMDGILHHVETRLIASLHDATNNIIVGGAPLSDSLENECQDFPANIYETYGMTETCSHIALRKLNTDNSFTVLDGITIFQDNRDCLVISAPHLSEKELITNDIVEIVDENHFRWLGRADNVINSGGVKIFPEQVERKLEKLIPYRFFITGIPDDKLGKKVVLVIESNPQTIQLDKIRSVLDRFEIPKEILYLEKFVCSENGKILREKTLNLV